MACKPGSKEEEKMPVKGKKPFVPFGKAKPKGKAVPKKGKK